MKELLQVSIAQINVTVGDIEGNSKKIIQAWEAANEDGAQLVVFPELCVIGYNPEDLVLMPDFRRAAMQAVYDIAEKTAQGAAIIIGCVWEIDSCHASAGGHLEEQKKGWIPAFAGMTEKCVDNNKIYNAGLLIDNGKIVHVQSKTILPNYGVFDEKRLFSAASLYSPTSLGFGSCDYAHTSPHLPSMETKGSCYSAGEGVVAINWRGYEIAILICADVWDESLVASLENKNIEAVFVLNASPFEIGKYEQRLTIVKKAAITANAPVFYVNMVGGQDDIVFDGGSFVLDSKGEIVCKLPQFSEFTTVIPHLLRDLDIKPVTEPAIEDDEWQIWSAMKLGLGDYVQKNGFSGVLLGLSGGIDSAVTAALAVDALGAENVLGVLMPSPYSSQGSIDDALETASLLGIKTRNIPISSAMEMFDKLLSPEFDKSGWMEEPEIGGNLQARLRAVVLMGLSNRYGSLLLSTGNKSEIAVGYSTLYGDSCGGYNVLKDLYKTQVYKLANWRNTKSLAIPQNSINKAPSAELKPDQRDEDNLPPYDILDDILDKHIEGRFSAEEVIVSGHERKIVERVFKLVRLSEYKRHQSCLGVKISPMSFSKDRRYPLTNKF